MDVQCEILSRTQTPVARVLFKPETYAHSFQALDQYQDLGRRAYLLCLETMGNSSPSLGKEDFFLTHKHVTVVCLELSNGSKALKNTFFILPDRFLRDAEENQCTYLYLMGAHKSGCCIFAIGGIALDVLKDKASRVGAGRIVNAQTQERYAVGNAPSWEIHRSLLCPLTFYDELQYKKEDNRGHVSAVERKHPVDLYLQKPSLSRMDTMLLDVQDALGNNARMHLIERRFRVLSSISDHAKHKGRTGEDQQRFNFQYIVQDVLFEGMDASYQQGVPVDHISGRRGLEAFDDIVDRSDLLCNDFVTTSPDELKRNIESLSHWIMDQYVVHMTKPDEAARKWISDQEERLLQFNMKNQCNDEQDVIALLQYNDMLGMEETYMPGKLTKETFQTKDRQDILATCESLFEDRFPKKPKPETWFSACSIECLELELSCLAGSITVIEDGRCYLSYCHLQEDYIPKRFVCTLKQRPQDTSGYKTCKIQGTESEEACLYVMGEEMLENIASRVTCKSDLPHAEPLPPIEDCANFKMFPPCNMLYHIQLKRTNHLRFHERYHYSSFLLDAGWNKETVATHFRDHFLQDGGTTADKFEAKYMHITNRKEQGQWEDGKRKIPYGMGCERLISGNLATDSGNHVGCPFRFLEEKELKELLSHYGSFDAEALRDIVWIAKNTDNQKEACANFFTLTHGSSPYGENSSYAWRPRSPQGYFRESLRRKQRQQVG